MKRHPRRPTLPCAATLAVALSAPLMPAQAAPREPGSPFFVDAFGTFGLAVADRDQPRYRTDQIYTDGIGSTPTAKIDSRAGLQLGGSLGPRVEVNVQGLLANNQNDATRLEVSWAYAQIELDPAWFLKLGRYRTPWFLYSDTLDVGYAYPWVRPPVELYTTAATFHSDDGLLLQYRRPLDNARLQIDFHAGRTSGDVYARSTHSSHVQLHQMGVAATYSRDSTDWFATVVHSKDFVRSATLGQLADHCAALGGNAPCGDYSLDGVHATQYGLGVRRDDGRWMLAGEVARNFPGNRLNEQSLAYYLSGGYHLGNVLPYVTYSALRNLGPASETRFDAYLNSAFTARQASQPEQRTWSLGARWDARPGLALKAQFDNVHPDSPSPGTFSSPLPANAHSANVFSLTLDWTY
ncbi:hypothetical protein [Aquabacterium sp.]|uniref:hypothetical protein n=1 Tax=Aquabacterium sp. TaxID=1872578 RepID=UPI0035B477D7